VKNLDYWKIIALVGTIIFLLSGFLPMIADSLFTPTASLNLFNLYAQIGQAQSTTGSVTLDTATIGLILTIILWPITLVLGLISILRKKASVAAGILGLLCWIGTLIALAQYDAMQYAGIGVYIGIAGAIIIAAAYFIQPSPTPPQITVPPPPPQTIPNR
jgi:hypothetical protein